MFRRSSAQIGILFLMERLFKFRQYVPFTAQ
jgi:hypothetical protein